jgi:hypothetical protein
LARAKKKEREIFEFATLEFEKREEEKIEKEEFTQADEKQLAQLSVNRDDES